MAILTHTQEMKADSLVVTLKGSLDASNATGLSAEMDKGLENQGVKNVVWVANDLQFIASAGLRVVMTSIKTCIARGGKFYLVGANANIAGLIKITGMEKFLWQRKTLDGCF